MTSYKNVYNKITQLNYFYLIKKFIFPLVASCFSIHTHSVPLPPATKDISGKFPIELQQKFTFFADSSDAGLAYFVAKQAGVTNQPGTRSVNLKVVSSFVNEPPFPQEHLRINGNFDSTGSTTDLSYLLTAAKNAGLTLRPAPVSDVETFFIADGFITDASGKIQPYCTFQSITLPNGVTIQIPTCSAMDQSGTIRPLQSIYSLNSSIDKNGNTQQLIPFDAKAFTQIAPLISEVLASGAGWDNFFSGQLRWQINNGKRIEIATLTVNWLELYAEIVKHIASLNYVATPQDIYQLALRIVTDTRLSNTVKIKLASGYSWGPWWNPNMALVENVANEILRVVKSKALIHIDAKSPGTGVIKRFHAINIDYKKITEIPIQTFSLYQRNNTVDIYAYTDLSVQCVVGTIDGEISWNTSDQRCNYLR